MTDLATGLGQQKQTDQTEVVTTATPTVITEQEVLFGTAVAVAVPAPKTHRLRDAVYVVAGTLRAAVVTAAKPPARRHYPKRYAYLESALMSREMDRL